jgi:type IV pilus assembly protein PilB
MARDSSGVNDGLPEGLFERLLVRAHEQGATHLHLEPGEKDLRVRIRVDGQLRLGEPIASSLYEPLLAHIKREASMDVGERRLPQSGVLSLPMSSTQLVCEVEVSPGVRGEKVTLVLTEPSRWVERPLSQLGMAPEQLQYLSAALRQRSGLIVFTGPLFSGKNAAIYSCLHELRSENRSMASIEWAVRGSLPEVHQLVLKPQLGLDMATAMRALLRGDHEVIYLREMIDTETAELAMRAALSHGRLVLTTVHTQNAASVLTRLEHMGFDRWLIARSLLLLQGQRQVRRLCLRCRRTIKVEPSLLVAAGLPPESPLPEVLHVPGGCEVCQGTGHDGRILICETLPVTPSLQELILAGATARKLQEAAVGEGMKTMRRSALERVCEGLISLDEVLLSIPPDADYYV